MQLMLEAGKWDRAGSDEDPRSRLMLREPLEINGFPFHVEAYAVTSYRGEQRAADETFANSVDALLMFSDCAYMTQSIGGRDYIIAITPHGD